MESTELNKYLDKFITTVIENMGSFILGIVVLFVGWWLIKRLIRILDSLMLDKNIDPSLRPFFVNLVQITLRVLLIFAVASMIGLEMTSFIAALGAAGLAVGLSLQGSLANFAGGVILLLFKPFEVGDFISSDGHEGIVRRIDIFYTYLQTANKRSIIVPNGSLANSTVLNASRAGLRDVKAAGVEMEFKVGYHEDLEVIKQAFIDVVTADEDYVDDPGYDIYIKEFEEDYLIYNVQAWVKTDSYYRFLHELPGKVKKKFDEVGIELPYEEIHFVEMTNSNLQNKN